jgi:hypothetical protein
MRTSFQWVLADELLFAEQSYPLFREIRRIMPVSTQTELLPTPPASPSTRVQAKSPAPAKNDRPAEPPVYWGDRLTLKFWLFCFGLMAAMTLFESLHRFVLFLMGCFSTS